MDALLWQTSRHRHALIFGLCDYAKLHDERSYDYRLSDRENSWIIGWVQWNHLEPLQCKGGVQKHGHRAVTHPRRLVPLLLALKMEDGSREPRKAGGPENLAMTLN